MEYFENTTRITKDGYAAILQMKRKQHHMVCRALGILLAIPFLELMSIARSLPTSDTICGSMPQRPF